MFSKNVSRTFLVSCALLLAGCGQVQTPVASTLPLEMSAPVSPAAEVVAAPSPSITAQSVPLPSALADFFFLEPLNTAGKTDKSKFDASLTSLLTVTVCRVNGATCPVIDTLTSTTTKNDSLRLNGDKYMTNWSGKAANLQPGQTIRITVSITTSGWAAWTCWFCPTAICG